MRLWSGILVFLLTTAAPAVAEDWVRVDTANFVVFGQIGEQRTRDAAIDLERFRVVVGNAFPRAETRSSVPTVIIIFESGRAFAPYRPRHGGRKVAIGGLFTRTSTDNTIALAAEDPAVAVRTLFHEYVHLVSATAWRSLPTWIHEGLAEFYSTFAIAADGSGYVMGGTIGSHVATLRQYQLLSLEELLSVDRTSAAYNQGLRRTIFYAQSWAMIHMFLAAEPHRARELTEYMRLVSAGTSPKDAWTRTFGTLNANRELRQYLGRRRLPHLVVKVDDMPPPVARVSQPTATEVEAILAWLLRYGDPDAVAPRLRRAAEMDPPSALARALLGLASIELKATDEGERLLRESAGETTDRLVQHYVAAGRARLAQPAGTPVLSRPGDVIPVFREIDPSSLHFGFASSADTNDWLADAVEHEPGLVDSPLQRIAGWQEERLLLALAYIRNMPSSDALNRALERGALLHAEISLFNRESGHAPSADGWESGGMSVQARDGWQEGLVALDPQLFFARRVFDAMRPPLPPPGYVPHPTAEKERVRQWFDDRARNPRIRQWYRAIAADLSRRYWLADLIPHLEAARVALPGDAGVLFDSACLAETLASPRVQTAMTRSTPERVSQLEFKGGIAELERQRMAPSWYLEEAEKYYRQALRADPPMSEARVRLSRVLVQRGRPAEALGLLEPPIESTDPIIRYFGALVRGDALEQTGRLDEARASYKAAATLFPTAQTPHLALSRIAREQGDLSGAKASSERAASLASERANRHDPWWTYYMCNGRNAAREISALRKLFGTRDGR